MQSAPYVEELVTFPSEQLLLEGVLAYPVESRPHKAILLLAPHPQMGGNMENNVIEYLARHAAEQCLTLRFNYRGVGNSTIKLSTGTSLFDHWTKMEEEQCYDELLADAQSALRFLGGATQESVETVIIGYSLGSILAGMLTTAAHCDKVVAVAPPNAKAELQGFDVSAADKLFIAGTRDFAFNSESFQQDFETYPAPKAFIEIKDADHFFRMEEERIYAAIAPFILDDDKGTSGE